MQLSISPSTLSFVPVSANPLIRPSVGVTIPNAKDTYSTPYPNLKVVTGSRSNPFGKIPSILTFGQGDTLKQAKSELKGVESDFAKLDIPNLPANDPQILAALDRLFGLVANKHYAPVANQLMEQNPESVGNIRQAFQNHVFTKEGHVCEAAIKATGEKGSINFAPLDDLFTLKYVLPTYNSILKEAEAIPKPSERPKAVMVGTGRTHFTGIALASLGWDVTALEIDPKVHQESQRVYAKLPESIQKNLHTVVADGKDFKGYKDADLVIVATMAYPKGEIFDEIIKQTQPDKTKVVIRTAEGLGQLLYEGIPKQEIDSRFKVDKELAYYPYQNITSFLLAPKAEYKERMTK